MKQKLLYHIRSLELTTEQKHNFVNAIINIINN